MCARLTLLLKAIDCDLLVRDSHVEAVTAALFETGDYAVVAQYLGGRISDRSVASVARLQTTGGQQHVFAVPSLWSETDYELSVDSSHGGGARHHRPLLRRGRGALRPRHAWRRRFAFVRAGRSTLHPHAAACACTDDDDDDNNYSYRFVVVLVVI